MYFINRLLPFNTIILRFFKIGVFILQFFSVSISFFFFKYGYATVPILLIDICIASSGWLLQMNVLWTFI